MPPHSHGCHPERRTLVLWLVTWDRALALGTFAPLGSQVTMHWVSFLTSSDFQIKYDLIDLFIYFFEARSHYIALGVLELTELCLAYVHFTSQ